MNGTLKTIFACILTLVIIVIGAAGNCMNRFGSTVLDRTILFATFIVCLICWAYCLFSED